MIVKRVFDGLIRPIVASIAAGFFAGPVPLHKSPIFLALSTQ